ncbi:MAG TPA: inositol monophosphatase family protein [Candidatus Limnocylindrales bacterium]|nr:inositol monophosphatase family protein [Candidatus Limnocylindrales bacterium]
MSERDGFLAFAMACADAADRLAMRWFRRELQAERKPDRTFVTEADRAIERELRERIQRAYPRHGVLGEEYAQEPGDGETRWIIDPIDATHSYLRGIPAFATLLALEQAGEVVLGVISAPAMGQRWHALRGQGAFCGTRPIHVSSIDALAESQVFYASRTAFTELGAEAGFDAVVAQTWRDRGFGDFWGYALVAEGCGEAMMEPELQPWDLAAPLCIVEEAGGRLTDFRGRRTYAGGNALASNGRLHDLILELLAGRKAGSGPG